MAYCSHCGKEIDDNAIVCVHCGCAVSSNQSTVNPTVTSDKSSFGFGLLGFCVPLVGLILWLVWKKDTPLKAKSAGIGALIGAILGVVFYIIYFAIIAAVIGASGGFYY